MEAHLIELRFHGRGGQGVVTAAELFARAAAYEGKTVQSIPYFGAERRGALVVAYARVSDNKIWLREPVYNPDIIIILDQSAINEINILDGVKNGGILIINSTRSPSEIKTKLATSLQVFTADATGIALKTLRRPIVNTLMLGALSTATGLITMDSIRRAILYRFPNVNIQVNMQAVEQTATSTISA